MWQPLHRFCLEIRGLLHALLWLVRPWQQLYFQRGCIWNLTLGNPHAQVFLKAEHLATMVQYAASGDIYHCALHCWRLH